MAYSDPAAALIWQHSPFWVAIAVCAKEDTYRGQIPHWHHQWSSFNCDTQWAYKDWGLPLSKLLKLPGCFWSKSRSWAGWAQKLAVNYVWQQCPVAPAMSSLWQKTVLYVRERCSVWAEHCSAMPTGLAVASPLAGCTHRSACHFYGSLSIDPTEQADLCFSS